MNKLILIICSLYSLNIFADSSSITSVAKWKAVAIKDSTRSREGVEISSLGAANLIPASTSGGNLTSGFQSVYALPLKKDIPEYKLFTKVISNTLSNEENNAELEVGVFYGNKPVTKNTYQQILVSDKKDDFSFKVANASNKVGNFNGDVDIEFLFVWDDSKSV